METIIIMSAVSVVAALVTLTRVVGWRRVLRHATLIDVVFTFGIFVIMAGTLTGALVAVLGGLMMAVVLSVAKGFARGVDAAVQAAPGVVSRFSAAQPRQSNPPRSGDPEFDGNGVWIYNTEPYTGETK